MKRLHTFAPGEAPLAEMLKERLAREGVVCVLRNAALGGALGEIPFVECYPELWLLDDETWPRADFLLSQWLQAPSGHEEPWSCPDCGETISPPFDACWKCGCERP